MPVVMRALRRKPPTPKQPAADPRFKKVSEALRRNASTIKKHPPAKKKADEAAAAAKGPPNEKAAGAKEKQVDKMEGAKTKKPESNSFLALLRAEIEKAMPKTLGDTEKFMEGGQSGDLKGSLKGNVSQQKEEATGDVSSASKEQPKQAGIPTKESKPVPAEPPPGSPEVRGSEGMPAPKSAEEVSLQDSKQDSEAAMADAEVTPTQLKKANDPRFSAVLTAKDEVGKQADEAPGKFRTTETATLAMAASQATASSKKSAGAMLGVKGKSKTAVLTRQQQQKLKDEQERKKVADDIEGIYNRAKECVETKLATLETEVGTIFDAGTDAALAAMTSYVNTRLHRYKVDRYLSIPLVGQARWVRDQFRGLPDEVNVFYTEGRALFTSRMDALVVRVANLVETRLKEAKAEIARGQAEIKQYVAKLPKNLQSVGKEAQTAMEGRFKELEQGIEDKKNQLAQQLAQKYKEANEKADKALKEIQDANKGLVAAFIEKLAEIIKILLDFKDKLMAILRKAAAAIKLIIADPIGFLSNLIGALKKGFNQFKANIESWLIKGIIGWLFGALAEAGVTPPADFSLPSILKLVLQILGITYERMREKAVKLLGPTAVGIIEKLVGYVKTLMTGGPAALWEEVKGDLADLKDRILGDIKNMIIESVIKAAVAKIVSMFNPVGAIVQAVLAIYNTVMFVVEQASRIMQLVSAVVDSVMDIAQGAIDAAANKIEQALGAAIPILIGFLARLIGIGDIPKRATAVIKKVQDAIDKAIDKALAKIIGVVKKMLGVGKGKDGKDVKVTKTLSMAGEGHTITAELKNGHLTVHMASGRLQELLGATAVASEKARPTNPQLANNLSGIYDKLKRIEEDLRAAIVNNDPALEEKLLRKISNTAEQLQSIGAMYGIKNLIDLGHASKYVKDKEIKPEYRGDKFRPTFYGGWNATAESHRKSEVKRLVGEAKTGKWATDPLHKNKGVRPFVCRDADGGWTEHLADANAPRNTPLDHKKDVSTHWMDGGNNMKQDERVTWNNTTGNLQVICQHHNSSKGGAPKTYAVGKNFRGPGE
jgi:hypothetical protein